MNYLKPVLVVAGIMLLLATLPSWPYGYYQALRIVVTGAALFGAYQAHSTGRTWWVLVLGGLAVLFNPIAPIHLDKESWMVPDIISALVMFVAALKLKQYGE